MWDDIIQKIRRIRRKKKSQLFHTSVEKSSSIGFFSRFADREKEKNRIEQSEKKKKNWFKIIFWILFDLGLVIGLVVLGWVIYITMQTPSIDEIVNPNFAQSSVIYDSEGKEVLYTLYGEENRKIVSLGQISKNMQKAMLAAEDSDFYNHSGLDWMGIARSIVYGIKEGRAVGGGSTLTQQLIKNIIFAKRNESLQEKVTRKIQELTLARQLENKLSKDRILELYLNKVPFGRNTYGVERAANIYFGKKAKDLTIAESAMLASLPQAPGRYSRNITVGLDYTSQEIQERNLTSLEQLKSQPDFRKAFTRGLFGREIELANGEKIWLEGRVDYVLGQMKSKGFITPDEFNAAVEESKILEVKKMRTDIKAPHFVNFVENELDAILTDTYGENFLQVGGLQIYTTLDYDLQKKSEKVLQELGDYNDRVYNIRNGAVLLTDPKTGKIKVMLGSRDYFATELNDHEFDGEVNVLTSARQPGSSFKPISYAAAFEYKGLSPATILMDVKTNFGGGYIPRNFDGEFHGPLSIRKSLGNSFNIPAVKAGIIAGLPKVFQLAELMGIHFARDIDFYGSSISLGSAEITPLDMGMAYSTFANGGYKVSPISIEKIIDKDGKIIYEYLPNEVEKEPVIQPETAFLITDILKDPKARGAGWSNILSIKGREVAAKTGTSTAKDEKGRIHPHDAWTIGYTPQYVGVVWVGNNKGWKENPTGVLSNKASGLSNAGKIWQQVMTQAHENLSVEQFEHPGGVRKVKISKISGKVPAEGFPEKLITQDYFSTSFLPDSDDQTLKILKLVEKSKLLPTKYTPEKAIKEYASIQLHSYYPNKVSWEKPVKEWVESEKGKEWIQSLEIPDLIVEVPEKTDPLYPSDDAGENLIAPEIRITSPVTMGTVTPPAITASVDITAVRPVSRVEFFWDNELVATKRKAPWTIELPISGKEGSTHLFRAEVIDNLSYMGEHTIEVAVGKDEIKPKIAIVYPSEGKSIEKGELLQIKADASDSGSSIVSVEFSLDGEVIGTQRKAPFTFSWNSDVSAGRHTLIATATDGSGNTKSDTVGFSILPQLVSDSSGSDAGGKFRILSPDSGFSGSGIIPVSFYIPQEHRSKEAMIKIFARKKGGKKSLIYSIPGDKIPKSGKASFSWSSSNGAGEYSLSMGIWQGVYQEYSQKVNVEIQ